MSRQRGMDEQLAALFGRDDDPDSLSEFNPHAGSVSKTRMSHSRRPKIKGENWYKDSAEDNASTRRFRKGEVCKPESTKENHDMVERTKTHEGELPKTHEELEAFMKKAREEAFNQGVEQGSAQAKAEASATKEEIKDKAVGIWASIKNFGKRHQFAIGTMVGVGGAVIVPAAYAAYKEGRDEHRVQVGDTTVAWNTGGAPAGGQTGGQGR